MAKTLPKLYCITLNGVDVSSYLYRGLITKGSNQPVKSGSFKFNKKINNALTMNNLIIGKSFTVQRGFVSSTERYIFRGEVLSYKLVGSIYEVSVACKMYAATRIQMDYTYNINIDTEAGVGSEIAKDLITEAGLTYSAGSIVSTGTGTALLINTYPAKGSILDSLKDLGNMYSYTFYYKDSEDLVYFTPKIYDSTSTTLTTGVDIINRIQWNNSGEDLANNVTFIGGQQLDWATENFAGPVTEVTLLAVPVDTDITVDGIKVQRGINSSDPKDFYVEADNKKIIFTVSSSNIVVSYSYNVPVKVNVANYDSIEDYVQYDKIIVNSKLLNTNDAELKASSYVDESSQILTDAPLFVIGNDDLELNQIITIVDNVNNINTNAVVNSIEYTFPYFYDKVSIGKLSSNMNDWVISAAKNIVDLQRQLASDTDVNVQLINVNREVNILGYTKVEESLASTDGLYWDSSSQGQWDTYYWDGTGTGEVYRASSMIPINKTVFEDFYSDEFKGTYSTSYNIQESWTGWGNSVNQAYGNKWISQIFTANNSYDLGRVNILVYRRGGPGTVTVTLRATTLSGSYYVPSGPVLASGTFNGNSITTNGYGEWISVDFSVPYAVTSGNRYAITISAPTGTAPSNLINMRSRSSTTENYPGGTVVYSLDAGSNWVIYVYSDIFFETYSYDITGSDATWGTNGTCSFTANQRAQSTYYLKDLSTNYTHFTATATYSGTLTLTVSGNGTTWNTFSNGVEKAMDTSFNYLYWRAVETGGSTASLTKLKITYR